MFKVVHIHSDPKFINDTDRFVNPHFDNTIIMLGSEGSHIEVDYNKTELLSTSNRDIKKAVGICATADLVVLYDLDISKSLIATRLPPNVKVAWRFFGYELYRRLIHDYLSPQSISMYHQSKSSKMGLRELLSRLRFRVLNGKSREDVFRQAIGRADMFLGLSRKEYEHLTEKWGVLPDFIQIPFRFNLSEKSLHEPKNNTIVVGNNRGIYNNHLDVIDLISDSSCDNRLLFVFPFSYGSENHYTASVRQRIAQSSKSVQLIEDFLPKDAYYALINRSKAAVFNGYRQMAMWNIFTLLASGTKVYLNTRNVIYHWFTDLGIKVYTIEQFALDLESGDLELGLPEKLANYKALERMQSEFSMEKFANEITSCLYNRD